MATKYQNGANSGADFAFLVFDTPDTSGRLLGDVTGYFGISPNPPGGLKYSEGYPSEGYFQQNCATSATVDPISNSSCFPVFCASELTSSDEYNLEQSDSSVRYGGWFSQGFGCYMTGGSSGGPLFQQINSQWYMVGVNSHVDFGPTYTDGCFRDSGVCGWYSLNMWAPYFNQVVIDNWTSLHHA